MTTSYPALGVRLALRTTQEGGWDTPLIGGNTPAVRLHYRPNWGLPGWPDGEQTGAPVLGFSGTDIGPGDTTDAVIIPMFPVDVPRWGDVTLGDVLRMYEGNRICGTATVLWLDRTELPVTDAEAERLLHRLTD